MHRRAVALDEFVVECIRRGMFKEAELNTAQWRDRRRSVRSHLERREHDDDLRGNDFFAVKGPPKREQGVSTDSHAFTHAAHAELA